MCEVWGWGRGLCEPTHVQTCQPLNREQCEITRSTCRLTSSSCSIASTSQLVVRVIVLHACADVYLRALSPRIRNFGA